MPKTTPRWKVRKLGQGRWLAHHPGCPPREHFCLRWLSGLPRCRILPTLPDAYREAAERYRSDVANDWLINDSMMMAPLRPELLTNDELAANLKRMGRPSNPEGPR